MDSCSYVRKNTLRAAKGGCIRTPLTPPKSATAPRRRLRGGVCPSCNVSQLARSRSLVHANGDSNCSRVMAKAKMLSVCGGHATAFVATQWIRPLPWTWQPQDTVYRTLCFSVCCCISAPSWVSYKFTSFIHARLTCTCTVWAANSSWNLSIRYKVLQREIDRNWCLRCRVCENGKIAVRDVSRVSSYVSHLGLFSICLTSRHSDQRRHC